LFPNLADKSFSDIITLSSVNLKRNALTIAASAARSLHDVDPTSILVDRGLVLEHTTNARTYILPALLNLVALTNNFVALTNNLVSLTIDRGLVLEHTTNARTYGLPALLNLVALTNNFVAFSNNLVPLTNNLVVLTNLVALTDNLVTQRRRQLYPASEKPYLAWRTHSA